MILLRSAASVALTALVALAALQLAPIASANEGERGSLVAVEVKPVSIQNSYAIVRPIAGRVEPRASASLSFEALGRVKNILVDLGDEVQQGQLLAELDCLVEKAELAQAQSAADQASAMARLAGDKQEREDGLFQSGHISERQLREVREQNILQSAALRVAQASVRAGQARVSQCQIKAPWDGTVSARLTEVGQYISPNQVALNLVAKGAPIVKASLPASLADQYSRGSQLQARWRSPQINGGDSDNRLFTLQLARLSPSWMHSVAGCLPSGICSKRPTCHPMARWWKCWSENKWPSLVFGSICRRCRVPAKVFGVCF